ncbi:vesicle-associated membrane protein 4-like isoform X1 [Schistocerca nitens]|uniref:vesicle-associated membrane protein 4-like isoform X1 n=1 Tax=Schistocerca nitens TaxID=7011 RepID=UPI0021186890|nr:vesicle-associated membrane protein 4-like isoform X1 [Schistocerca nitens]
MPPKFKKTVPQEDLVAAKDEERASLLEQQSGSEEDEGFFLNSPSTKREKKTLENERIKQVHGQITEVIETLRDNVKILDRGKRLEELQDTSDRLTAASIDFREASNRMKRRAWAQQMRTRAVLIAVCIILLVGLIDPNCSQGGILKCLAFSPSGVSTKVPVIVHYSRA